MLDHLFRKVPKPIVNILENQLNEILGRSQRSSLSVDEASQLLKVKNSDSIHAIALVADLIRQNSVCADHVTFVINRNINFTNACVKKCGFCSFSRTGDFLRLNIFSDPFIHGLISLLQVLT